MHQDLGLLLRARQQKLMNYQYFTLTPMSKPLIPPSDEIDHISCLQLPLENKRDFDIASQLYARMPVVINLAIKLKVAYADRLNGVVGEVSRKVIHTIFKPANMTQRRQNLKRLRVEGMSFELASVDSAFLHQLERLENLHLIDCRYTNRLCAELCQLKLGLRSFRNQRGHIEGGSTDVLKTFIKSLRLLRDLRLSCSWQHTVASGMCDYLSLVPHAHELRCLYLENDDVRRVAPAITEESLSDFHAFCSHASELQQLSIEGPCLREEDWNTPLGLQTFLVGFADNFCTCLLANNRLQNCLRKLKSMRVLSLAVFVSVPTLEDMELSEDGYDSDVDHELYLMKSDACRKAVKDAERAANHIFDSLAQSCPLLVALSIDLYESGGDPIERMDSLRTKQIDLFGNTRHVARSIEAGTIKFYEPCSDVLETENEEIMCEY